MVEKGKDRDRDRDQGQPKARASPKKVKKEVKKTRRASHPEKFEAKAPDGHHRDCILLLSFLSDSRIVSHSSFACKWQNRF